MGTALLDDSGDLETCGIGYMEFLDTWNFGGSIPTLTGILHKRNEVFSFSKVFQIKS